MRKLIPVLVLTALLFPVFVMAAPRSAPTEVTAELRDNGENIKVKWKLPKEDKNRKGFTVFGYDARSDVEKFNFYLEGKKVTNVTIKFVNGRLTPGITYKFRVATRYVEPLFEPLSGASNHVGYKLKLPGPPTDVEARGEEKGIVVKWTPPADAGDSAISQYTVYFESSDPTVVFVVDGSRTVGSFDATVPVSENATLLTHEFLIPGITYKIRVAARNGAGYGDKSPDPAIEVPYRVIVPAFPTDVNASVEKDGIHVTWSPPVFIGDAPISQYNVYLKSSDPDQIFILSDGTRVTGTIFAPFPSNIREGIFEHAVLISGITYTVTVTAQSRSGEGDPSDPAIEVPYRVTVPAFPTDGQLPAPAPTPGSSISPGIISLPNPLNVDNFKDLIDALINWLLIISLPVVILLVAFAGFQYMVSGVSPDAKMQAINMVKYAVIGYAIMLLAKVLVGVVTGIF